MPSKESSSRQDKVSSTVQNLYLMTCWNMSFLADGTVYIGKNRRAGARAVVASLPLFDNSGSYVQFSKNIIQKLKATIWIGLPKIQTRIRSAATKAWHR